MATWRKRSDLDRQRESRRLAESDVPACIGPAELSVAVRCPGQLFPLMRKAGGVWEPGSRRWLIERRRIEPLIRSLRRAIDVQARLSLEEKE